MQYVVEGGVSFLGTKGKISFACLMHCEGPINRNRRLTMCPLPSVFLWKLVRPVCSGFFTILLEFDKIFLKQKVMFKLWFKGFLFFKPKVIFKLWFKGFLFSKLTVIVG